MTASGDTEIRRPAASELATIQAIARRTIEANYRAFLGDDKVDWFIGSGESDKYIRENLAQFWVLTADGELAGFSVCKSNTVDLMMVDHPRHRSGFGTMLLQHSERRLFAEFDCITLESFAPNSKANNFYRKNGWIERSRRFDETAGVDMITFEKRRAGA